MFLAKLKKVLGHYAPRIYWGIGLGLFFYVVYRAFTLGFTHDESLTYTIVKGRPDQLMTANNHWLNTVLAWCCSKPFGYTEWALRLPNVLAFIPYLFGIHKLGARSNTGGIALLLSIPALLLNPFLLDFFSLCRGYGLALSFLLWGILLLLAFFERGRKVNLWMGLLLLAFSIYANYAFFIPVLALQLVLLFTFFNKHKASWPLFLGAYLFELILLIPAIWNIHLLTERNELYFGGIEGVFRDTLKTLVQVSFTPMIALISVSYGLVLLHGFFIRKDKWLNLLKPILLLLIALPELLHYLAGMKYPLERAALYWVLLAGIFIQFSVSPLLATEHKLFRRTGIGLLLWLNLLLVYNFFALANWNKTITWDYDGNTREAMQELDMQFKSGDSITLSAKWLFIPAIEYYREQNAYLWLDSLKRVDQDANADFFYIEEEDTVFIKDKHPVLIKSYPDTESALWKAEGSASREELP